MPEQSVAKQPNGTQQSTGNTANGNGSLAPPNVSPTQQQMAILLSYSVEAPWERVLHASGNSVPYFKNRQSGEISWDHPLMTELLTAVQQYNYIRFAAYRTAMKLRVIQKHLHFDKLTVAHLKQIFQTMNEKITSERSLSQLDSEFLDVPTMCNYLMLIYNNLLTNNSNSNSNNGESRTSSAQSQIAAQVDLALNWLLNVFDVARNGRVRTLAFRLALALLSNAQLEEKYVCLFRCVAERSEQTIDSERLSIMLSQCLQLTRQLGEIAAFGGSNVEPSVRSCVQMAKGAAKLTLRQFLAWTALEPQSLVWLPVLHRLTLAESARHLGARCTVCKQQPIVGLRYRCLRCFAVDLCQNCFFAGLACKSHKLSHPTQEYCTSTSAKVHVRELTRICCNRLRPALSFSARRRALTLAYLPVQTVHEGSAAPAPPLPTPPALLATPTHVQVQAVQSPADMLKAAELAEADELEARIASLEQENRALQKQHAELMRQRALQKCEEAQVHARRSALVHETEALRAHRSRMQSRLAVLELHNAQLEAQLDKIKLLLAEHQIPLPPCTPTPCAVRNTPPPVRVMSGATSCSSVASVASAVRTAAPNDPLRMVGSLFMMADEVGRAAGDVVLAYTDELDLDGQQTPKACRVFRDLA